MPNQQTIVLEFVGLLAFYCDVLRLSGISEVLNSWKLGEQRV